jgi:TonB-dependent SusC/RagA subfamily outer membrane receptor
MTARPARFLAARRLSALLVGGTALLAACGAELPTAAEVEGMDVASAERRLVREVRLDTAATLYVVDGIKVAAIRARGIAADSIVTIEVRGVPAGQAREIRIATREGSANVSERRVSARQPRSDNGIVLIGDTIHLERRLSGTSGLPLLLVNGVKSTQADLDKVAPNTIETVEVLKGAAAVAAYGPEASNGAIRITLRK